MQSFGSRLSATASGSTPSDHESRQHARESAVAGWRIMRTCAPSLLDTRLSLRLLAFVYRSFLSLSPFSLASHSLLSVRQRSYCFTFPGVGSSYPCNQNDIQSVLSSMLAS